MREQGRFFGPYFTALGVCNLALGRGGGSVWAMPRMALTCHGGLVWCGVVWCERGSLRAGLGGEVEEREDSVS